jgi:hypothetical protein
MKCLPGFSYCIINLIRPAKSLHKINPKYLTLLASGILWSLSTVSQTNVKFLWIDIYHIPSIVSSLQVPTANLCHLLPLVGLLPPILHSLESRCPSRLAPLQFRFSWLLPKSPCSIHLFRSTKVTPRVFATQSYLLFTTSMHHYIMSLFRTTSLRTILQCRNLNLVVATREYTSPVTQSRLHVLLKSFVPTWIRTVSGFPRALFSINVAVVQF